MDCGELADWVVPLPEKYAAISEVVRQHWPHLTETDPLLADRLWEAHEIESTVMNARVRRPHASPRRPDLDRAVCPGELAADTAGEAMNGLITDYRNRYPACLNYRFRATTPGLRFKPGLANRSRAFRWPSAGRASIFWPCG